MRSRKTNNDNIPTKYLIGTIIACSISGIATTLCCVFGIMMILDHRYTLGIADIMLAALNIYMLIHNVNSYKNLEKSYIEYIKCLNRSEVAGESECMSEESGNDNKSSPGLSNDSMV